MTDPAFILLGEAGKFSYNYSYLVIKYHTSITSTCKDVYVLYLPQFPISIRRTVGFFYFSDVSWTLKIEVPKYSVNRNCRSTRPFPIQHSLNKIFLVSQSLLGRSLACKALTQKRRDCLWSKCLGLAEIHAQFCKHRHYRKPYQLVSACFIQSPLLADELS